MNRDEVRLGSEAFRRQLDEDAASHLKQLQAKTDRREKIQDDIDAFIRDEITDWNNYVKDNELYRIAQYCFFSRTATFTIKNYCITVTYFNGGSLCSPYFTINIERTPNTEAYTMPISLSKFANRIAVILRQYNINPFNAITNIKDLGKVDYKASYINYSLTL